MNEGLLFGSAALAQVARFFSSSHNLMAFGCRLDERSHLGVDGRSALVSGARMPRRTSGVTQPCQKRRTHIAWSGDQPYCVSLVVVSRSTSRRKTALSLSAASARWRSSGLSMLVPGRTT